MKNRLTIFTTVLSVLAGFAFLPQMQAGSLPPEILNSGPNEDGCYSGFNTAEGCFALDGPNPFTGFGNTAVGWEALNFSGSAILNTGLGAGAGAINTGNENTATGAGAMLLNLVGNFNTSNGTFALVFNSAASNNTAIGDRALENNDITGAATANDNTAVGVDALFSNTDGNRNCAVGSGALFSNLVAGNASNAFGFEALFNNDSDGADLGLFNNAFGWEALFANVDGIWNTAMGDGAGSGVLTDHNSAFGANALSLGGGGDNTAIGFNAGTTIGTGSFNVALGSGAGAGIVTASNSIAIGVPAVGPFADFSFTCFIGSIFGEPVSDPVSQVPVFVDSNNVVGIFNTSSRVFKHDIKPMDKASEALLALKPVTFKYNSDKKGTTQYGLIAEDVAEVNPDLVYRNRNGEITSVRYEWINVLLLNEFLKEHKKVEEQQASISQLKNEMQTMVAQLKEQAAQIQKVSAQLEVSKPAPQVVTNKP